MRTLSGSIKRPHVEDVNTLHLSDKFETLKTGSLLNIGRDGTGFGTRGNQVFFGLDFCTKNESQLAFTVPQLRQHR